MSSKFSPRASLTEPSPSAFLDNDRWLAVGDSITQNGGYCACVYLYYATRFPDFSLEPRNAGIAGDSAAGALSRYAWDIAPQDATVATVMFGMNDVDRGVYGGATTPEVLEKRREALANYARHLSALAARLKADGARVILVTPTLFDETAASEVPRQTGVNGALAECAAIMRRIATEQGHALIDVHGPMSAINARLQANDPALSVVGPDRIHPGAPGHLLLAYLLLKGQGAPALVSSIELDAADGRVRAVENATVDQVRASAEGLDFTVRPGALPYPVFDDAKSALGWIPFHEDLNQENLRVTGLAPGLHALSIDGTVVRRYSGAELAKGVNLALETETPQMRQAREVGELVRRWQQIMAQALRVVAQVEYWQLRDLPRPVDFDAARPRLAEMLAGLEGKTASIDQYHRGVFEGYLRTKPNEQAARAQLAELAKLIRSAARPRSRVYRLVPVEP